MPKVLKYVTIVVLALVVIITIFSFYTKSKVADKLEQFTKNLPEHIQFDYNDVHVNPFYGNVDVIQSKIVIRGTTSDSILVAFDVDTISVTDFGYWDYFVNDKITIENISVKSPKVTYYHNLEIPQESYHSNYNNSNNETIEIASFNIHNGDLEIYDFKTNALVLSTDTIELQLLNIISDASSQKNRIPFNYQSYALEVHAIFQSLNEYDNLQIASLISTDDSSVLKDVSIKTKYTQKELSQHIRTERDHFDVKMDSIVIKGQKFDYKTDSTLVYEAEKTTLYHPIAKIYRNKMIADDPTIKPLYSQMLRHLNFDLMLHSVYIKNGELDYYEEVHPNNKAGSLVFNELEATIMNLGNTYGEEEKTTLEIRAEFMRQAPMKVSWEFDVNDQNDQFLFSGEIGQLPAADLNEFITPTQYLQFEGALNKTYFTISGTDIQSVVDLKINYDDFRIILLEDNGRDKKGLLTAIANLFVKKSSENEANNMRTGHKEGIQRDRTKSIFNFLWLNVKAGMTDAML